MGTGWGFTPDPDLDTAIDTDANLAGDVGEDTDQLPPLRLGGGCTERLSRHGSGEEPDREKDSDATVTSVFAEPIDPADTTVSAQTGRRIQPGRRSPRPPAHPALIAAQVSVACATLWIGLSLLFAIIVQLALHATPDWRVGLILAALSFGGEVSVQTHHWALLVGTGPLLPGLIVALLWVGIWRWIWHPKSGSPMNTPNRHDLLWAGGLGTLAHALILGLAAGFGSMSVIDGQGVWLLLSLGGSWPSLFAFPLLTVATGLVTGGLIPDHLRRPLGQVVMALVAIGLSVGLVMVVLTTMNGANPLVSVLAFPIWMAIGIGLASASPLWIQVVMNDTAQHVGWGLTGVQGTLPVPGLQLVFLGIVGVLLAVTVVAVRAVILRTQRRVDGLWVVGLVGVVITVSLGLGQVSVSNLVAHTAAPPVLDQLGQVLHNALTQDPGATWTLRMGVHWAIGLPMVWVIMAIAYGLGVLMAGPVQPAWSGRELEGALQQVYRAGLMDQRAYEVALARVRRAKERRSRGTESR